MTQSVSAAVLQAARNLANRQELGEASMADIAAEAGVTRVTLYRRGETRPAILAALREELAREERDLLVPIVLGDGDARGRLSALLTALCEITDSRIDVLAGLDNVTLNAIYHEPGEGSLTRSEFIDPLVRLLRDGAVDGTLRSLADPLETATALYTQVTYSYTHLRREHGWSAERATLHVVDLAEHGVRA